MFIPSRTTRDVNGNEEHFNGEKGGQAGEHDKKVKKIIK
jgi:hypothetical protein